MRAMIRAAGALFAAVLLAAIIPMYALAANPAMNLTLQSVSGRPGDTVTMTVSLSNNPGIASLAFDVNYDEEVLTLTDVALSDAFGPYITTPSTYGNPQTISMVSPLKDVSENGLLATLTFTISENAQDGTVSNVTVTYDQANVFNGNLDDVALGITDGVVNVYQGIPGDVNGDQAVNNKDAILLFRYVAGWSNLMVDEGALDCSGDGSINNKDAILLFRFVAGWPVEIVYPGSSASVCSHNLEAVAEKAPTCTEAGNIAYWHCTKCGKYFANATATQQTTLAATVVAARGHSYSAQWSHDDYYHWHASTCGHTGEVSEKGAHTYGDDHLCSVCGMIDPAYSSVDRYAITYDIANGDSYIAKKDVDNPNVTTYCAGDTVNLNEIAVEGYRFLGWYDGAGNNSTRITRIDSTYDYDVKLYAHWEIIEYNIQYESDLLLDTDWDTYTVKTGKVLPTPKVSSYVFAGWTDEKGKLYSSKKIPAGTTGDIILRANWTSERNKTYTNPDLSDPIIVEDENEGVILFAYEIGRIENVPLKTIHDFGYIEGDGVHRTETVRYSTTITKENMETLSNVIANATTKSSNWVLSEDWNETTSVDEEWCEAHGYTKEEAETIGRTNSTNWNTSNSSSGSTSSTATSYDNHAWSNEVKTNSSIQTTDTSKTAVGLEAGLSNGVASVKATASQEWSNETISKSGINTDSKANANWGSTSSNSASASWNTSASYGGSSTVCQSSTVTTALTEEISNKKHYGTSYANGGSETVGQEYSSETSSQNGYSATVVYSKIDGVERESTWTTYGTKTGYHRWILTGTAHVFGVVAYDVKTQSYSVFTYSIMDDETQEFEDFSTVSGKFTDEENGVITFEVPYDEIDQTVSARVYASDGLKVNLNGTVTEYKGTDTCVVIPEYYRASTGDYVKITGISSTAFKGNQNIVSVVLSDFITDIPDSAFEGCTSLVNVRGEGVTKIGARAFAGCTSFDECMISPSITSLGESAFEGAELLYAVVSNKEVAVNAIASGAENITLDVRYLPEGEDALDGTTFTVPSSVKSFELRGGNRTFSGLTLVSEAQETILNKITIEGTAALTAKLSSSKVKFISSSVSSPGIALALTADNTQLGLYGTCKVSSTGTRALLTKSLSLSETAKDVEGMLQVESRMAICGTLEDNDLLLCPKTELIDEDTFNRLLSSYQVTFDANGGTCSESTREVANEEAIGELPVPTRDDCTFEGWYVAGTDTQVSADTVLPSTDAVTLRARWTTDYILTSDAPQGGIETEAKWTYTQRNYSESSSSTKSEWTLYDTVRTSWGSEQTTYSDPTDGKRNVWKTSEQYVTSYTHHYVYYHKHHDSKSVCSNDSCSSHGNTYHEIDLTYALEHKSAHDIGSIWVYGYYNSGCGNTNVWFYAREYDSPNYGWRDLWHYQEPVYTYYFYKDTVGLESTTDPTGLSGVSDVVAYAKYLIK